MGEGTLSKGHGVRDYGRTQSGTDVLNNILIDKLLNVLSYIGLQALASYEQAAKLQSTAEFKLKIASLKKQIQREKAGGGKVAAEKENRGKPASNFAFADGRRDTDNTGNNKASKVLAAPNVGEIRNDADYAEAKKGMVRPQYDPLCFTAGMFLST